MILVLAFFTTRHFFRIVQASWSNVPSADVSPETNAAAEVDKSFIEAEKGAGRRGLFLCNDLSTLNESLGQEAQSRPESAFTMYNGSSDNLANKTADTNLGYTQGGDDLETLAQVQVTAQTSQAPVTSLFIKLNEGNVNREARVDHTGPQVSTVSSSVYPVRENHLGDDPLLTCRGRCGFGASFPCGCSASCVVYQTCCRDIALDCPHVVQKAWSEFQHLITADVLCDDDAVLKITSCPKEYGNHNINKNGNKNIPGQRQHPHSAMGRGITQNPQQISKSLESPFNISDLEQGLKEANQKFYQALLSSSPMTDLSTGFTFINRSIYECHGVAAENISPWSLQLDYIFPNPTNLADLEPLLKNHNTYMPLFNERILFPHLCSRHIVRKCNRFSIHGDSNKELEEKCLNGTAGVVQAFSDNSKLYFNIFCAYCNEGRNGAFMLYQRHQTEFKDFELKVLMSHSGDDRYSLTVLNHASIHVSWLSGQCFISQAALEQDSSNKNPGEQRGHTVCSTTCSKMYFTHSPDGICRAPHTAVVALTDAGLPPLCRRAIPLLADFIICGLKHLIPSLKNADFHPSMVTNAFDKRLNKTLHVVRLHMELPTLAAGFFANQVDESWSNYHRLAVLVKTFALYRTSHNLCNETEENGGKSDSDSNQISLMSQSHNYDVSYHERGLVIRGEVVDSENKTTFCLSFTSRDTSTNVDASEVPFHLMCSEEAAREKDEAMIQMLANSRCFKPPPDLATSRGGHVTRPAADWARPLSLVTAALFALSHIDM
ncbi:hypothetical protein EGW08_009660 [Elysia chlorotica]|uniref:SMB domain-containing protein n=1 Tax=Elysia chlorotica TaxID=188477 RepID=A0A3S0ZPB1_ELYCH|nr:hypothetical protein EGW08_009660 [Elysia chlorotica]